MDVLGDAFAFYDACSKPGALACGVNFENNAAFIENEIGTSRRFRALRMVLRHFKVPVEEACEAGLLRDFFFP
jgi:hypothetical protein